MTSCLTNKGPVAIVGIRDAIIHFGVAIMLMMVFSCAQAESKPAKIPAKQAKLGQQTGASVKPKLTGSMSEKTRAERLWFLLKNVYQRMEARMQENSDAGVIREILESECSHDNPNSNLARALRSEGKQLNSNKGLSLRGAYTTGDIQDDTGEGNAYLELSWDVLNQGYRENRKKAKRLHSQAEIAELRGQLKQHELSYRCRRYQMNQSFAGMTASLLAMKLELMEPVYTIERRAYFKGWSYLDDLLVSEQDIRLARQELKYLHSDPYWQASLTNKVNPPLIDIDIQQVIAAVQQDDRRVRLSKLEKQVVRGGEIYRRNNRLRLFLRKEFEVDNNGSDGVVAGLRFTIPLEKRSSTRHALNYRMRHAEDEARLEGWERTVRTRAAYESLQEQMQRVIKQHYRFERTRERVRRVLVQKGMQEELLLAAAVARVRSYMDAGTELVRAKEELYRRANEVFLVSRVDFDPSMVRLVGLDNQQARARVGDRSVYIWSKGFNAVPNRQLLDFMQAKAVTRVMLSMGKKTEREKLSGFIKQARENNIHVEAIIGDNNWVYAENHDRAAAVVAAMADKADSIHLDIEPHVMDGYKQNREVFLQQYINMLKKIRVLNPDLKISLSVPVHWPEKTYRELATMADRVYLMAYETNDVKLISRRVNRILPLLGHARSVVALRARDFADEWALEKAIEGLSRKTGALAYAVHQFRDYIRQAGRR